MSRPVADAEALVGSLMEQSLLVEKEKALVLSIPSLSSVPSTILQRKIVQSCSQKLYNYMHVYAYCCNSDELTSLYINTLWVLLASEIWQILSNLHPTNFSSITNVN